MTARNIASATYGLTFDVDADGENGIYPENYDPVQPRGKSHFSVKASLPGAFNAYNLMAAITAVSSVTGKSFEELAALIPNLTPIKGRMTVIDEGQPFELIVDYAHTPSSFETIFPPLRKRCNGRIFALFGSGGERDLTKRPLQGQIAAKFCDVVVLADEDPRGEDPVELLKMIAEGALKEGKVMGENELFDHLLPLLKSPSSYGMTDIFPNKLLLSLRNERVLIPLLKNLNDYWLGELAENYSVDLHLFCLTEQNIQAIYEIVIEVIPDASDPSALWVTLTTVVLFSGFASMTWRVTPASTLSAASEVPSLTAVKANA